VQRCDILSPGELVAVSGLVTDYLYLHKVVTRLLTSSSKLLLSLVEVELSQEQKQSMLLAWWLGWKLQQPPHLCCLGCLVSFGAEGPVWMVPVLVEEDVRE